MKLFTLLPAAAALLLTGALAQADDIRDAAPAPGSKTRAAPLLIPAPRYVLRINGYITPAGLVVQWVDPWGPAARVYLPGYGTRGSLEPGDRIVEVNGWRIHSARDYFEALASGGRGEARLLVRNVRGGFVRCVARPVYQ